jgi:hypothetical protein
VRHCLVAALEPLPEMTGRPIRIEFLPRLTSRNHRLESQTGRGAEVHAASFLRQRRMVLDSGLIRRQRELARILVHELFHFVWVRTGNASRLEFEGVLRKELTRKARGELGWSAEWRKRKLRASDVRKRTRRWREYVCESFCDSAAWLFGGAKYHREVTLAARFRGRRKAWFLTFLGGRSIRL